MNATIVTGYPHTWTYIPDGCCPWQAFAGASEGGGTPPEWTQDENPKTAIPPADAAGSLWRVGDTPDVPPTIAEMAQYFAEQVTVTETLPIAAYFSSGGRGVFLLRSGGGHYVVIARSQPIIPGHVGHSEHAMCRRIGIGVDNVVVF